MSLWIWALRFKQLSALPLFNIAGPRQSHRLWKSVFQLLGCCEGMQLKLLYLGNPIIYFLTIIVTLFKFLNSNTDWVIDRSKVIASAPQQAAASCAQSVVSSDHKPCLTGSYQGIREYMIDYRDYVGIAFLHSLPRTSKLLAANSKSRLAGEDMLLLKKLPGSVDNSVEGPSIWKFPKIRATMGGPYNEDSSILGFLLGSPYFVNYHMGVSQKRGLLGILRIGLVQCCYYRAIFTIVQPP